MSRELTKGTGTAVASLQNLQGALENVVQQAPAANTFSDFMKFGKDGIWAFGKENLEVEEDSHWLVLVETYQHGLINWGPDDPKLRLKQPKQVMLPANQPLPKDDTLEHIEGGKWVGCWSVEMLCVSGADQGTKVRYQTQSEGGRQLLVDDLIAKRVLPRLSAGEPNVLPVVLLVSDSYQHETYGKIYKPMFDYQEWLPVDGAPVGAPPAEVDDAPEAVEEPEVTVEDEQPAPRTSRRRASRKQSQTQAEAPAPEEAEEVPVVEAEVVEEPVEEAAPAPRRRRRRRG